MARYHEKSVRFASVNGYGLEIVKIWARTEPESDAYYQLRFANLYGEWGDDEIEFETEEEALRAFHEECEALEGKPNWEAQAAYDAAHGTINGEDPGVVAYRELVGE